MMGGHFQTFMFSGQLGCLELPSAKQSGVEWPAIFSRSVPFFFSPIARSRRHLCARLDTAIGSPPCIFASSFFPWSVSPTSTHGSTPLNATMATTLSNAPNHVRSAYPPPSLAAVELSNEEHMVFTVNHGGYMTCRSYLEGVCVGRHAHMAGCKAFSPLAAFNTWRGQSVTETGTVADHVHLYFVGDDNLLKETYFEPATNRWTRSDLCIQHPLIGATICCGIAAVFEKMLPTSLLPQMHVFVQLNNGTIQQFKAQLEMAHLTDACRYLPPGSGGDEQLAPSQARGSFLRVAYRTSRDEGEPLNHQYLQAPVFTRRGFPDCHCGISLRPSYHVLLRGPRRQRASYLVWQS